MSVFIGTLRFIDVGLFAVWMHTWTLTLDERLMLHVWILGCNAVEPSRSRMTELEDLLVLLSVLAVGFFTSCALERSQRIAHERRRILAAHAQTERLGDSQLNHVIKNKTAGALFILDNTREELEGRTSRGEVDRRVSGEVQERLDQVKHVLLQCADWCHMREMFVQLQRGVYHSSRPLTDLTAVFLRFDESATFKLDNCPRWLNVDSNILLLCLEEGVSNANKYRDPNRPFVVTARLKSGTKEALISASRKANGPSEVKLDAIGESPVAFPRGRGGGGGGDGDGGARDGGGGDAGGGGEPDEVAEAENGTWLHVSLDNANADGVPTLTPATCEACMAAGVKGNGDTKVARSSGSHISDGLGLDCVRRATLATGGAAFLSTYVEHTPSGERGHTVLHCVLPCALSTPTRSGPSSRPGSHLDAPTTKEVFSGVLKRAQAVGSAVAADTPVQFGSVLSRSGGGVSSYGGGASRVGSGATGGSANSSSSDGGLDGEVGGAGAHLSEGGGNEQAARDSPLVGPAAASAMLGALAPSTSAGNFSLPYPPRCLAIDDSPLLQSMLKAVFVKLGADSASRVLGDKRTDCDDLMALALESSRPPDLIILDEHIELPGKKDKSGRLEVTYGSDLALQMRRSGYRGLLCLCSGESLVNLRTLDAYNTFDLVLTKGNSLQSMVDVLQHKLKQAANAANAASSDGQPGAPRSSSGGTILPPLHGSPQQWSPIITRKEPSPVIEQEAARRNSRPDLLASWSAEQRIPPPTTLPHRQVAAQTLLSRARAPGGSSALPTAVLGVAGKPREAARQEPERLSERNTQAPVRLPAVALSASPLAALPVAAAAATAAACGAGDADAAGATAAAAGQQQHETDEFGHPLFDMSSLEGLPPESVRMLLGIFFHPDRPSGAPHQLAEIRERVASGEVAENKNELARALHQVMGCAMQAGTKALGERVKAFRSDPCGVEGIDRMVELLAHTEAAVRRLGAL